VVIAAWQKELTDEDQTFLRSMQNSRKVKVHRTGAKVKKQAYCSAEHLQSLWPSDATLTPHVGTRSLTGSSDCQRRRGNGGISVDTPMDWG
jgi:hypothetical protein